MKENIKFAITEYQCSGCINGDFEKCYKQNPNGGFGCGKHMSGTIMMGIGKLYLGMPKGFNRLGHYEKMIPHLYEEIQLEFDKYNIPVWKHLDENGNTLVRGIRPRLNEPFLYVFLGDVRDDVDCIEISREEILDMD